MQLRLTIVLPVVALFIFAIQSYVSWRQQARLFRRKEAACFWWSNLPLDSKPLQKSNAFAGLKDVTQCGFEMQAFDRFGPSWATRLFVFSGLPAFLGAFSLAHGLGKYGVSEVKTFMISAPVLLALWFYGIAFLVQHWRTRRLERRQQGSPRATSNH